MDTRLLPLTAGAGLVGGVCGALLAAGLFAPSPESSVPATEEGTDSTAARLESLEAQNASLRRRLRELEGVSGAPPVVRADPDAPTREEFEALRARVDRFDGGAGDPAAPEAAPELAAAIDDVLARREEAAQVEKREREAERIREGAAAEAKRWTEYLSLTTYQQEQLSGLLATRNLRATEIKREWASGEADSEALGRAWRDEEAAFREGLEGLLTPVQLESWDAAQAGRGKD